MELVRFISVLEGILRQESGSEADRVCVYVPDSKHRPWVYIRVWLREQYGECIEYRISDTSELLEKLKRNGNGREIVITSTDKITPEIVNRFSAEGSVWIGGERAIGKVPTGKFFAEYLSAFASETASNEEMGRWTLFVSDVCQLTGSKSDCGSNKMTLKYVSRRLVPWLDEYFRSKLSDLCGDFTLLYVDGNEEYTAKQILREDGRVAFSTFVQTGKTMEKVFGDDGCMESNPARYMKECYGNVCRVADIPSYPVVIKIEN